MPEFPTTTQVLGLGQATPSRPLYVPLSGLGWRRQVRPPSVLRRSVPYSPTATQVLRLGQATPRSPGISVPLGLGWRRQVRPPSVLRRIVPKALTATQVLGLGQATPCRSMSGPLIWLRAAASAARSDKRPPSGGATSTSGSSTDSTRSRDNRETIAAPPLFCFPAPRRRPNNPRTTASVVAGFTLCSPQPGWPRRGRCQGTGLLGSIYIGYTRGPAAVGGALGAPRWTALSWVVSCLD